ncbi:methyltransferase domain-containing protein [Cellulosimicrobium sp. 22601]|uniref:class I SAM-dependent methyltransferase n=1 Tax=unclassified Cellulosimicrobium TaxID=2624466 RepID=UPI003F84237C
MTRFTSGRQHDLVVTAEEIRLPCPAPTDVSSIDVLLDGNRVWSIDLVSHAAARDRLVHRWPAPLRPFLDGTTEVSLRDSSTDEVLWSVETRLGTGDGRIHVVDATGRHVAMNKWGRLGKTFDGDESGLKERLLDRLDVLVDLVRDLGHQPFVVGGTLLGAVRSGKILPHDDDADLAYLSELEHPADISREQSRIERELTARGYEIVRHSNAHLQITFRRDDGLVDGYIDIFTAFFRDGQINQPFHVRGPMARESMVPFSTVTLEGRHYPAPASPEDWLVVNYDENWRTPLPGYKLRTPRATARRFRNWFGSYNFQRDFWEERYLYDPRSGDDTDLRGADVLLDETAEGHTVLDLGCGTGAASHHLARGGRRVIGVDYSETALLRARQAATSLPEGTATFTRANLIDFRDTAPFMSMLSRGEPVHALGNHLVERLGHHGRATVWRLLRQVARADGVVVLVVDTEPDPDVTFRDPTTWHLTLDEIAAEIEPLGLALDRTTRLGATARDRLRGTVITHLATRTTTKRRTT